MKIFIIGGTGLVGSYLLPKLLNEKHEVYILTRSENKIDKINKLGAYGILGDIKNPNEFVDNLPDKLDFIVLLAMPNIIPGKRITNRMKKKLRNETNDFFKNSMELAVKYNIPVILPGGISYKTVENEIADENWPIRRIGLTEIGKDTDNMIYKAIKTNNPKVIQLIYGKIYGNGGLFRFIYNMALKGSAKIIGDGNNYIPNIHAGDAALAIVKTIEKIPVGEKFIIADDTPVTQNEFMHFMTKLMNKKPPVKIPGILIKLVLGKDLYEVVKMNCKVSNKKAKEILGWQPEFPSYIEGLESVIEEMKSNKSYFT